MSMSTFFRELRSAYQAELDDLRTDSDGHDVLRRRLQEKRGQMPFLCQMIETSPEMVAVAFHGGFHFELPAVMEQLITLEADEFPDWASLADAVHLHPWAHELARPLLDESRGEWFLTVAAALEYLQHRPSSHHQEHAGEDGSQDAQAQHGARHIDHGHDYDPDNEQHQTHDAEEVSADWLAGQGFDRKE